MTTVKYKGKQLFATARKCQSFRDSNILIKLIRNIPNAHLDQGFNLSHANQYKSAAHYVL